MRAGKDSADGVAVLRRFPEFSAMVSVLRAGHVRFACEVSGAVMPPAAGTHRSDSGEALRRP
ncbi:MAG TPA: hypothetical protein ENH44_03635 [Actinobacteria bacterium]|nr:hypothetical protein [Actinomycetota bacterium]